MQVNMPTRKNFRREDAKVDRDEMARIIAKAWSEKLLSQKDACLAIGIDQGHFSKLVRGMFKRPSGHAARLFEYAKEQLAGPTPDEGLREWQQRLTDQLMRTWDHTPQGARALENILAGVAQLRLGTPESPA